MRKIPYYSIILGVLIGLMLVGCGGGSGGSNTTAYVENDSEDLTSLGEFPVGISDYTPSTIKIKNATGEALATTEVVSTTDLEQVAKDTWKLVITGTFTAPEMSGNKLEIAGVYVNWEPLSDNDTDAVHLPTSDADGTFTKTLYVTSTDVANIYFPITVAVVDEKHYVVGERAVIVLQSAASTTTVTDAVKIYGNKDFVLNAMNMAVASIDGQNLAPYIPGIKWTIPPNVTSPLQLTLLDISPRNVMLQGIEVSDYTVESDGAGGYKIHTDLTVRDLIIEYNNNNSIYAKGKNYINMRTKYLGMNNGFILWLKKESDGYQAYLTTDDNVEFITSANTIGDLDTPFISGVDTVIDFILDFLQDTFKITVDNPIHINLAQPVLTALIKEIAGNDPQQLTPTYSIQELTMDNSSIALSMDGTMSSLKTYTTPGNDATSPTMDLAGTNSTIAIKDDLINQALASYLVEESGDIPISDLDAYIQNLIDNLGYGDLEIGIWNWLKDADTGKYPPLNIHFAINTPPIFTIDATGATLGTLHLRDLRVDIQQVDDVDTLNLVQPLASISIDMDMRMQWKEGKLTLSLINHSIQYTLLFNKLYPLYLPSEIKELPTAIANMLNDIFTKLGIVGYTVKDMISTGGYLAIHGDLGTYTAPSTVVVVPYSPSAWNANQAYLATLVTAFDSSYYPIAFSDITSSLLTTDVGAAAITYTADNQSLTWDDGMAYMYPVSAYPDSTEHKYYITHIAFSPTITFTGGISTINYYEEFALLGVTHESQLDATYTQGTGSSSDPSIAPKPAYAIARDVEFNDSDLTQTEAIATGTIDQDLPFCTSVGIALRFRKSPEFPLWRELALQTTASNIEVTMVDLKLKGLSFE